MDRFIPATIWLLLSLGLHASLAVAAPASLPDCSTGPQNIGPGSYVLNADQKAAANSDCWIIVGDNITIDLQGFTVMGGSNPGAAFNDFRLPHNNIVIRNGTITRFQYGIIFGATQDVHIESMRIVGNRNGVASIGRSYVSNSVIDSNIATGIALIGSGSIINSSASHNGSYGASGGNDLIVIGSAFSGNGSRGIRVFGSSIIAGNTASDNQGNGIVVAGGSSTITGNIANNNVRFGISVRCPSTVVANFAQDNGGIPNVPFPPNPNLNTSGTGCQTANNLF